MVGFGPAGVTLATLAKRHDPAASVLLIDKAASPRHCVGEFFLYSDALEEMGADELIRREPSFVHGSLLTFVWGRDRRPWQMNFDPLEPDATHHCPITQWTGLRSRYDEILLQHAQAGGVIVWPETMAVKAVERRGRVVGLTVRNGSSERKLSCATLADCGGRQAFLPQSRRRRQWHSDVKTAVAYGYFHLADWPREILGTPEKAITVTYSVPAGFIWCLPLTGGRVSIGVEFNIPFLRSKKNRDLRQLYFDALKSCGDVRSMLKDAPLLQGIDPADPAKDFFTSGSVAFQSRFVSGPGWIAAGDSGGFASSLVTSGVMLAHDSGRRAACVLHTLRRRTNGAFGDFVRADYGRFSKELTQAELALGRYMYSIHAEKPKWAAQIRRLLDSEPNAALRGESTYSIVIRNLYSYAVRSKDAKRFLFGCEDPNKRDPDLKPWVWPPRLAWTLLALLEGRAFPARADEKAGRRAALSDPILDDFVPRWRMRHKLETVCVPKARTGILYPIQRFSLLGPGANRVRAEALRPAWLLPALYADAVSLLDGRRSVGAIKHELSVRRGLPQDVIGARLTQWFENLLLFDALEFVKPLERGGRKGAPPRSVAPLRAEWALALRGESRIKLGQVDAGVSDLRAAVTLTREGDPPRSGTTRELACWFDRTIENGWLRERIRGSLSR